MENKTELKIVMVPINSVNEDCLYLYDYKNGVLTFKSSRNKEYLQKEKLLIEKGMCYTNLYNFPIKWLSKLNN